MDSSLIRQLVRPFYPVLSYAVETGWMDGLGVVAIIGNVRKAERAAIVHATVRESLRELCDACDPFLTMTEEPEGKGLDALRLTLDENVLALR